MNLEPFEKFMDMLDKNSQYDAWIKSHTVESYAPELAREITELIEGIQNKDREKKHRRRSCGHFI